MANSYMNMARSTNGYAVVRRALSLLGMGTHSEAHAHLATSSADANLELAGHLNRQQRRVMNKFPVLNQSTQSLAMLADTRTTVIPATVRDMSIINLYYDDDDDARHKHPVTVVPYAEIEARHQDWYNGTYTQDWPEFAVIQQGDHSSSSKFEWYGMPTTARTLTLVYQADEVDFVSGDITNSASTKYVMVPDELIDTLAYSVAASISEVQYGVDDRRTLAMWARADKEIKDWAYRLVSPPIKVGTVRMTAAGFQPNSTGRKVPSFTRSRRGGRY